MTFVNPASRATASHRRVAAARARAMPFNELPIETQTRIRRLIALPSKPARWLSFSFCEIPSRAWYEWHWARGIDPDAKREGTKAWVKSAVIKRDGYVCQICGGDVEPTDVHLDHIVPWSKGGPSTVKNLQVTHSICNMRKGNRTVTA